MVILVAYWWCLGESYSYTAREAQGAYECEQLQWAVNADVQHEGEAEGPAERGWYRDGLGLVLHLLDGAEQGTYESVEVDYSVDKKFE